RLRRLVTAPILEETAMTTLRIAPALGLGALALGLLLAPAPSRAQEGRKDAGPADSGRDHYSSREALNASYDRQFIELDRRRIADPAKLAAQQKGDEAE